MGISLSKNISNIGYCPDSLEALDAISVSCLINAFICFPCCLSPNWRRGAMSATDLQIPNKKRDCSCTRPPHALGGSKTVCNARMHYTLCNTQCWILHDSIKCIPESVLPGDHSGAGRALHVWITGSSPGWNAEHSDHRAHGGAQGRRMRR